MRENIQPTAMHDSGNSAKGVKKVGVYDRPEHVGPSKTMIMIGLVVVSTIIVVIVKYVF